MSQNKARRSEKHEEWEKRKKAVFVWFLSVIISIIGGAIVGFGMLKLLVWTLIQIAE